VKPKPLKKLSKTPSKNLALEPAKQNRLVGQRIAFHTLFELWARRTLDSAPRYTKHPSNLRQVPLFSDERGYARQLQCAPLYRIGHIRELNLSCFTPSSSRISTRRHHTGIRPIICECSCHTLALSPIVIWTPQRLQVQPAVNTPKFCQPSPA
jgi:hypothetical protein